MRIAGIIKDSVVNGIGIRDVIFTQGCQHHCKGCHNPKTWDIEGGTELSNADVIKALGDSKNDITISGGEPLMQFFQLTALMADIHETTGKRFWVYTGFKYEEIPSYMLMTLAKFTDVLVDGRFELDKKDLTLQFRGSSNQRLIDLPKSFRENKIILWEELQ